MRTHESYQGSREYSGAKRIRKINKKAASTLTKTLCLVYEFSLRSSSRVESKMTFPHSGCLNN